LFSFLKNGLTETEFEQGEIKIEIYPTRVTSLIRDGKHLPGAIDRIIAPYRSTGVPKRCQNSAKCDHVVFKMADWSSSRDRLDRRISQTGVPATKSRISILVTGSIYGVRRR
jgi:hypothetical protein